ncbi:DUF4920 domain-containing protein [Algoriphagus sediminis]|uniref:DUF4920 domain-containing protein n=1 Tax=Algoriphagus sediminis TaxID=3057113 RepID=A0ABT7YDB3_9BACT|nr:DUF4920 domain-containing protein [Algoriphagus sediminis]MDN3204517.1 DUF4920 domain-containing protein [Algoriphagus sediminis]
MKYTKVIAVLATGILFACQTEKKEEVVMEEKVEVTSEAIPGSYGEGVEEMEAMNTAELVVKMAEADSYEGQVYGEIKEVCTKKGCWLTMDLPDGESMRVTFKDYGFFVPTTSQGFPILLEGVATRVTTDVETLRHFAEDQGKSEEEIAQITEPKVEITFEATGVIIKDKA